MGIAIKSKARESIKVPPMAQIKSIATIIIEFDKGNDETHEATSKGILVKARNLP